MSKVRHSHLHSHRVMHPHAFGYDVTVEHEHEHEHSSWRESRLGPGEPDYMPGFAYHHRMHRHTAAQEADLRRQAAR